MAFIVSEKVKEQIQQSLKPSAVKAWRLSEKARAPDSVREVREVSDSRPRVLPRGTKVATPSERYEDHRERRLVAAGGKELDPCRRTGKGSGPDKLRACHVELDWLSPAAAASIGSKAGPHLRFCATLGKKSVLVPVTSPKEATRLSREFCKCVGGDKSATKRSKCALDVAGSKKTPQFGRNPYA